MDIEDLYRRYAQGVYRYVLALSDDPKLAEDVTSETFAKAIQASDRFEHRSSVTTWLYTIAKNTLMSELRHARPAALKEEPRDDWDTESTVERKAATWAVHKAIHRLEEPYKEVFSLRAFSDMSFADIGALFDKSESWARVTFFRAKTKIREDVQAWNAQ